MISKEIEKLEPLLRFVNEINEYMSFISLHISQRVCHKLVQKLSACWQRESNSHFEFSLLHCNTDPALLLYKCIRFCNSLLFRPWLITLAVDSNTSCRMSKPFLLWSHKRETCEWVLACYNNWDQCPPLTFKPQWCPLMFFNSSSPFLIGKFSTSLIDHSSKGFTEGPNP